MVQTDDTLALHNVKVTRGGNTICSIEYLHLRHDEKLAIVGPNGAGKTTLLKACCSLIRPDSGHVLLDGRDLWSSGYIERSKMISSIGYVPQMSEYNADLPFTVAEIVAMGLIGRYGTRKMNAQAASDMVERAIENAQLAPLAARTFRSLSGGEQQRTLIARALVAEPALLLMDEPGSNTDCIFRKRFRSMFESICGPSLMAVVIVSHDFELVRSCCHRAIMMVNGRPVFDGAATEVDEDLMETCISGEGS